MTEISEREKKFIVNKVAGALLFSVFGMMGFFYSLWRQNYNSAAWCILLEGTCTLLLVFSKPYLKGELHLQYSATFFRIMKYVSLVLTLCSWCALIAYIAVGAVNKEVFDVKSHYAAAPVAFMAGFWNSVLFFDTRKYETALE